MLPRGAVALGGIIASALAITTQPCLAHVQTERIEVADRKDLESLTSETVSLADSHLRQTHRELTVQACPTGWKMASGTIFDSWPKPGSTECIDYSGCEWAGMFSTIDGGSRQCCCKNGAQWLNGGDGTYGCRFPPSKVKQMKVAATWDQDASLLGHSIKVALANKPSVIVTANVKDVCNDNDCNGCCSENSSNGQYKLIDLEAQVASQLLGFNYSDPKFDVNDLSTPTNRRPGAKSWTMPLCYKVIS